MAKMLKMKVEFIGCRKCAAMLMRVKGERAWRSPGGKVHHGCDDPKKKWTHSEVSAGIESRASIKKELDPALPKAYEIIKNKYTPMLVQLKQFLSYQRNQNHVDGIMSAMGIPQEEAEMLAVVVELLPVRRFDIGKVFPRRKPAVMEMTVDVPMPKISSVLNAGSLRSKRKK